MVKFYFSIVYASKEEIYCFPFRYHRKFIEAADARYLMNLDEDVKNKLIISMVSIFSKDNNDQYSKRQINKTLEIIMEINDVKLRSKELVEKVFLNYRFLFALFNQNSFFNVANYCLTFDYINDFVQFMDDVEYFDNCTFIPIAALIQSLIISRNDALNQFPKSIGTQICSKIRCLNGLDENFTKFIKDYYKFSLNDCSLVAHSQLTQLSDVRSRIAHNFNKSIIDNQTFWFILDESTEFYLYDKMVGVIYRSLQGKVKLIKELELPKEILDYKLLRVFQFAYESFLIVAATLKSIICVDYNGREISKIELPNEIIKNVLPVGHIALIVFYENKNYIDIFDVNSKSSEPFQKEEFKSTINYFNYNLEKFWGFCNVHYSSMYTCFLLDNKDVIIRQLVWDFKTPGINISFKPIFEQSFHPLNPISGAFLTNVNRSVSKLKFFATSNENKFLSIELTRENRIICRGITMNMENKNRKFYTIIYFDNIVVFTDNVKTYLFNDKTNKLLSINGNYERVVVLKETDDFYRIYAYTNQYLDLYLTKLNQDSFTKAKLIDRYQFFSEIKFIVFISKYFNFINL